MSFAKNKFLPLLVVARFFFAGCTKSSTLKFGWQQTSTGNSTSASYRTFDGLEQTSFAAEESDGLKLTFEFEVEKGTLQFKLVSPGGDVLWESELYQESGSETVSVFAPESGFYQVQFIGESTGGSFDFDWRIDE